MRRGSTGLLPLETGRRNVLGVTAREGKRRRPPRPPEAEEAPEPTARPRERPEAEEQEGERLVPLENVGGAAPTLLGGDSGGDLPGSEDDLSNLVEPEPPESPEVGAVHVRLGEGPKGPRR